MCKSDSPSAQSLSPAAGSGIAAIRQAKLEGIEKTMCQHKQELPDDSQLKAKARDILESILLSGSASCIDGSNESPPTRRRSNSVCGQEGVRMECHVCGYRCTPQWLNDEAHCLKCQTVLKRRPSVHQRSSALIDHSSLRPVTAPSQPRSKSLCSLGMDVAQGRGNNSTNASGTYHLTLLSSLASNQEKASVKGWEGYDRARVTCHVCGYKCVPQWLNDEAHCLKCQVVLKTRPSIHQKSPTRSSQRRSTTPARVSEKISSRQLVGPERFYYDRSTYTGTHVHSGPC